MRKLWLTSLICAGFFAEFPPHVAGARDAADADYYVAVDGSDGDPGTKQRPFASLTRARDAVRDLKTRGLEKDVTVLVRGGTYILEQPLVFELVDSGTDTRSVTYAAYPGEHPVFSGGRPIERWRSEEQHWVVELPGVKAGDWTFRQLFADGERRPCAREPDEGFFRVAAAGPDNRTSFQFRPGDLCRSVDSGDARVVFLHDWSTSRVGISDIDEQRSAVILTNTIGSRGHSFFRITGFEQHPRYYVEQAAKLLDSPGEWHLNREEGRLSYVPHSSEQMNRVAIVAPVLDRLLIVRGDRSGGRKVKNLGFVGLTFAHSAAPRHPGGYAGVQAGFHEWRLTDSEAVGWKRMPAAVVLDTAAQCRIESCRIGHVGGTALSLEGNCENNRVVGNEIFDAGGNGVMVGEPSTAPDQIAKNNVVANNHIHHCGATYFGCVGVWAGITEGTAIAHNEIHDLPYTGVSIGWTWNTTRTPCQKNLVQYNHIHHVMQTLSDGGGIYTLGQQPGTILRGNLIHDVPVNAGRAESNGLFIDEGSSKILIELNTIYNIERSPIRFHKATNDVVRNNVLVTSSEMPPFRFNATDPETITFEANATVDPETWKSPGPNALGVGLEGDHRLLLRHE